MKGIRIIETGDGSHSLFHEGLNETFHSRHGAIQESSYVFIDQGLQQHPANPISILEYGFGTGLNALLTAVHAKDRQVNYTTLEAYPLDADVTAAINYADKIPNSEELFRHLHDAAWGEQLKITPGFTLKKVQVPFEDFITDDRFDLIYFDAFAPSRQPELWSLDMLKRVHQMIKSGGMFVTYSAMGQLKRDLAGLGMNVETLEGPPGKKEMVRATKP